MSQTGNRDRLRTIVPEAARSDRVILLALAGASFALQSVLLTAVSVIATGLTGSTALAGLAVGMVTGAGLLTDGFVGSLTHRVGTKPVLCGSYALLALGIAGLMIAASFPHIGSPFLWVSAVLFGLAFSLQTTPILGSLATHAGEGQITTQSVNAIAQRGAALIVFLILSGVLGSGRLPWQLYVLLAGLVLVMAIGTLLLRARRDSSLDDSHEEGAASPLATLQMLRRSRELRSAVLVTAATPLLVIFGASFVPLILIGMSRPELLAACLIGRELVAVAVASWLRAAGARVAFGWLWPTVQLLTIAGLAVGIIATSSWLTVVAFSLQGAMIGAGIVIGNVGLYEATRPTNRYLGFAAASLVSRVASLLLPLAIGLAMSVSSGFAVLILAVILAGGYAWSVLLRRSRASV
ncbi:MAG: MFS transporter [Leifsonia sp.]